MDVEWSSERQSHCSPLRLKEAVDSGQWRHVGEVDVGIVLVPEQAIYVRVVFTSLAFCSYAFRIAKWYFLEEKNIKVALKNINPLFKEKIVQT